MPKAFDRGKIIGQLSSEEKIALLSETTNLHYGPSAEARHPPRPGKSLNPQTYTPYADSEHAVMARYVLQCLIHPMLHLADPEEWRTARLVSLLRPSVICILLSLDGLPRLSC